MSKPFTPANAADGLRFMSENCEHCNAGEDCGILMRAMVDGTSEHWVYVDDRPGCSAFEAKHNTTPWESE